MSSLTDGIIDIAMRPADAVPDLPLTFARLSLLDWMTCAIAGAGEPLALKLRQLAALEGGQPLASVIGGMQAPSLQAPPRMAALVNGATSHALDYDDTHLPMSGICQLESIPPRWPSPRCRTPRPRTWSRPSCLAPRGRFALA